MPRIRTSAAIAGVAGAAAIAAGVGVGQAIAADGTSSSSSTSSSSGSSGSSSGPSLPDAPEDHPANGGFGGRGHHGMGDGRMGFGRGAGLATLATKLGVTQEKLQAAMAKVHDALDASEGQDRGTPPTDAERAAREAAFAKALAKELGIAESKVTDALAAIEAERRAAGTAALTSRLDQAVTDGKITAADKASILKAYAAGVLGGVGMGFGMGPGMGFGH